MSIKIIKAKHTPLALVLIFTSYFSVRMLAADMAEHISIVFSVLSYAVTIILFGLIGVAIQYAENKYIWGRFLNLSDNLGFLGLSIGLSIGFISLALW